MKRIKNNAVSLSVNVFSTKVLIGDIIFTKNIILFPRLTLSMHSSAKPTDLILPRLSIE